MHRSVVPYLMPKGEYVAQRDESKFEGTCRVQLLRSVSSWSSGIGREVTLWMYTVAMDTWAYLPLPIFMCTYEYVSLSPALHLQCLYGSHFTSQALCLH